MADATEDKKDPKAEEASKEEEKDSKEETKEDTEAEESTEEASEEVEAPAEAKAPAEEEASEAEGEEVEVPAEFKDIVEKVENMSVLELHSLVKVLEKKFGVSAQAVAAAAPAGEAAAEEQASFNVELTAAGDQKIAVIKAVKNALGLGLKEAKDLVEGAPAVLKEGASKEEADELKSAIEEAGGQVTLK